MSVIKNYPLLPKNVSVHSLIIYLDTSRFDMIVNVYV